MTFQEYSQSLLAFVTAHPLIANVSLTFREITEDEGHVESRLDLVGGLLLYISEYVFTVAPLRRSKYRYHVQNASGAFLCRWDNAPHHREIETFPDHCHKQGDLILPSSPMDIRQVLSELSSMLS